MGRDLPEFGLTLLHGVPALVVGQAPRAPLLVWICRRPRESRSSALQLSRENLELDPGEGHMDLLDLLACSLAFIAQHTLKARMAPCSPLA